MTDDPTVETMVNLRQRPQTKFRRGIARLRGPRAALALLAAFLLAGGLRAWDAILIPREDSQWDSAIRRGVELIRKGDLRAGIQILQGVVDDPASARGLKAVREDFGPEILLSDRPLDPSAEEDAGAWRMPIQPPAAEGVADGKEGAGDEEDEGEEEVPAPPRGRKIVGRVRIGNVVVEEAHRAGAEAPKPCRLYLPVAEVARQLLAGLDPEGIRIYRAIYDLRADDALRRAVEEGDLRLLRAVAENCSPSTAGAEARERLADALFEEGKFRHALGWWRSVLAGSPDPARAHRVQAKVLAGLRFLGLEEEYDRARREILGRLSAAAGTSSGSGAGTAQDSRQWIESFERAHPFRKKPLGAPASPSDSEAPVPALPGTDLEFEWASSFWSEGGIAVRATQDRALLFRQARIQDFSRDPFGDSWMCFPFFPAPSWDGREPTLFVNGTFQLQRLSASTGRVEKILTSPFQRRDLLFFREQGESPVYSPTVVPDAGGSPGRSAGIVLGTFLSDRVRSQSYMGYEITEEIPIRSLAAFERDSGRLLWDTGGLAVGQARRAISFTTPALVRGRKVFAGGWHQDGYINSILVALDLFTGDLIWHQLIASNQIELTMFGEMGREPFASALVEREGVLYYVTNLGALAAVDSGTGRILWLSTYDFLEVEPSEGHRSPPREIVWSVNPPLLLEDSIVVTPRDSLRAYAFDLGLGGGSARGRQGRPLWSFTNERGDLRDLIGRREKILYFTGPGGVQALDLGDLEGGSPRRVPSAIRWGSKGVEGRGLLTESGIVVAAEAPEAPQFLGADGSDARESRLWLVDPPLRKRTRLSEPFSRWKLQGERDPQSRRARSFAGNVMALPGRILVTSSKTVASFSSKTRKAEAPAAVNLPGPRADGAAKAGKEDL